MPTKKQPKGAKKRTTGRQRRAHVTVDNKAKAIEEFAARIRLNSRDRYSLFFSRGRHKADSGDHRISDEHSGPQTGYRRSR